MSITVTLTPEQEAWIFTRVINGVYASAGEAAQQLIAEAIYARQFGDDDLGWEESHAEEMAPAPALERREYAAVNGYKARDAKRIPLNSKQP